RQCRAGAHHSQLSSPTSPTTSKSTSPPFQVMPCTSFSWSLQTSRSEALMMNTWLSPRSTLMDAISLVSIPPLLYCRFEGSLAALQVQAVHVLAIRECENDETVP